MRTLLVYHCVLKQSLLVFLNDIMNNIHMKEGQEGELMILTIISLACNSYWRTNVIFLRSWKNNVLLKHNNFVVDKENIIA